MEPTHKEKMLDANAEVIAAGIAEAESESAAVQKLSKLLDELVSISQQTRTSAEQIILEIRRSERAVRQILSEVRQIFRQSMHHVEIARRVEKILEKRQEI